MYTHTGAHINTHTEGKRGWYKKKRNHTHRGSTQVQKLNVKYTANVLK